MAYEKSALMIMAGLVTLVALTGAAFMYSDSSVTGSVAGFQEQKNTFQLHHSRLMLISPRTAQSAHYLSRNPYLNVRQQFSDGSFTALVPVMYIPRLKLQAEARFFV